MGKSKSLGGAPSVEDSANNGALPKKNDDDIATLTEGLNSVSIGAGSEDVPDAIKSVADLISSNKYKNIVVLSGAGISCNAGIPGQLSFGIGFNLVHLLMLQPFLT
jgi:hypothetical protein